MNRALDIKNWSDGGNNYVLKASAENKWSGFQNSVITKLTSSFGDNFNIVIWSDEQNENDYYCIPFREVKHVFVDKHKTTGKYPNRWTAVILSHQFLMHSNSELAIDVSKYYSIPLITQPTFDVSDDFFIENAKAEINIRLGQSKFRNGVLKNFENKCALTNISEQSLLAASHIVPWSKKKECRGDIANGICLYVEIDALFDKGFISFSDELKVITTSNMKGFSEELKEKLKSLEGKPLRQTKTKQLNKEYLNYHRTEIFEKMFKSKNQ